jgi:hypothetical protein
VRAQTPAQEPPIQLPAQGEVGTLPPGVAPEDLIAPAPGTEFRDSAGHKWKVGNQPARVQRSPKGYVICPNGHPAVPPTIQDVKDATRCRSATPGGEHLVVGAGCANGTITELCTRDGSLKIEMLGSSEAEDKAWRAAGHEGFPPATFTQPHP